MEYIGTLIIAFVIAFVIFLLLREVNCWYWKINKKISLLEENNQLLKSILSSVNPTGSNQDINNDVEKEIQDLKLYYTNQGEIFVKQSEENLKIGDLVFNYFKRPYNDDKLTIKNGPKISIVGGRIVEINN
jgi:hypothetical protein